MEDMHQHSSGTKSVTSTVKGVIVYGFDRLYEIAAHDLAIVSRECDLFFGVILTAIGIFHFRSDKFCDGNSVDYLSCTRPSSYHYYGGLEIFLIVVGIFFILLWFLKRRRSE